MKTNRREFLVRTGCASLGAMALSAGFKKLGLMNLYAQQANVASDYRALVCIFLAGGNDATNMVVPLDATGYGAYAAARASSGLAIPQAALFPVSAPLVGTPFGFHPSLPELATLYGLGKVAVVCNVGPLVQPTTRATYQSGAARRPYQLFSHSDQVEIWQSGRADTRTQTGWGGRAADRIVSLNPPSGFPIVTSMAGTAVFGQGLSTRPLGMNANGPLNQVLVLNGFNASPEARWRRDSFEFLRTIDRTATLVAAASDGTQQAIEIMNSLSVDPTLTTVFPNTGIAQQLRQIAKVMKLNQTAPALNLRRQIFFATIGGFDTHQNELANHTQLYQQLSQAMNAFYNATVELGVQNGVTAFLLSDFGRTLEPSGSGAGSVGTDHGWGSHVFVMGGSVKGGNFYGAPTSNGTVFPTLQLNGPDDADDRGRFVPSVSVDQYGATLANWFGVAPADMPSVFPNIGNFPTSNLGFMA